MRTTYKPNPTSRPMLPTVYQQGRCGLMCPHTLRGGERATRPPWSTWPKMVDRATRVFTTHDGAPKIARMAIGALQYCLNQSKRLRNDQVTTIVGGIGGVPNLKAAPEPPRPSTLLKLTMLSLLDDGVDEYASILNKHMHFIRIAIWESVVMLVF